MLASLVLGWSPTRGNSSEVKLTIGLFELLAVVRVCVRKTRMSASQQWKPGGPTGVLVLATYDTPQTLQPPDPTRTLPAVTLPALLWCFLLIRNNMMLASKQQLAAHCTRSPRLAAGLSQRRRLVKAHIAAPIDPAAESAVLKDDRGFVLKQVG